MVGHDDEFVEQVGISFAIVKESSYQNLGIFRYLEDSAALPAFCGDKVGRAWDGSVLWCRHLQAFFRG